MKNSVRKNCGVDFFGFATCVEIIFRSSPGGLPPLSALSAAATSPSQSAAVTQLLSTEVNQGL